MVDNLGFAAGISALYVCHDSGYISITDFRGYIAISGCRPLLELLTDFSRTFCGRKFQICRWNFHDVSHSFRDINIYGFDSHFGLLLSMESPNFVVDSPSFAIGILMI